MTSNELYRTWAPDDSVWSNWAKPVLFADPGRGAFTNFDARRADIPLAWAPSLDSNSAIILDLDEDAAVWTGLALAKRGFRPVPLYNGAPGPSPLGNASALIPSHRIVEALTEAAGELAQLYITPDAAPVFLLDSRRSGSGLRAGPGRFDNRWAVFPQDFPSANFLLASGIRSVVLGQNSAGAPGEDLAHVLLRWQEAGIGILVCDVRQDAQPTPHRVSRPGKFRMLWYRALVLAGLRHNSAGGFGAMVPIPSQSRGYG